MRKRPGVLLSEDSHPRLLREPVRRRESLPSRDAIGERDEQYRALFETIPIGVGFVDSAGNISAFNDAFTQPGAYDRSQIARIGNMANLFFHPEVWYEAFEAAERQGSIQRQEVLLRRRDRTPYHALFSLIPLQIKGRPCWQVVVEDITESKRAETEIRQTLEKLRNVVDGIVHAMALMAEANAPHTAGHQRRVALLASAIAREMGLTDEKVDGVRTAALLHDIGKIWVPAEIYNKPGQISQDEFDSIKVHPLAGFEILKNIEFPWPVDRIVLQHHERMDGSGYPSGLPGKEILQEAKILAVADVIEAMASHRPYRAALGIDHAMEEISHERGTLYDSQVVDACIKCFTARGFKLD